MRYSIILFLAVCSLFGCGGSSSQPAKLRVVNGGWAVLGDLTVIVDRATVATGIEYPSSSNYVTVKAGGVDFVVVKAGSTNNLVPSQFQRLDLSPNSQNTFVLGGYTQISGYLFTDDSTPANGSVKLRIADADPIPYSSVSAWVNTDGSTSGNPTVSVTLGSASNYLTLTPGSYIVTFGLSCLGTPNCISVGPTALSADQNVTVYLLNQGESLGLPVILADN